ncbi:MAG: hypothetical protein JWL83_4577 [Actinomycetia bacterium]|nr:hypothetical protein [Actinomycetes bacterium]
MLDRIPREFVPRIAEILVSDDGSHDATYLVGVGYQQTSRDLPLTIVRQPENLGYGGNQKVGYRWAMERDLDIVVMLHGDGQYAPEHLPRMVEPIERGVCDAVLGSRMLEAGAARRGGMPLYKYVGNRILTSAQNALTGSELSEWHSGYRAYSVPALREVPFEAELRRHRFRPQPRPDHLEDFRRVSASSPHNSSSRSTARCPTAKRQTPARSSSLTVTTAERSHSPTRNSRRTDKARAPYVVEEWDGRRHEFKSRCSGVRVGSERPGRTRSGRRSPLETSSC